MPHHTTPISTTTPTVAHVTPPRQPSVPVLIVAHHDGYLEAYHAPGRADVHLMSLPYAGDDPDAERAAETYIDSQASMRLRDIYCPGYRRTLGKPLSARPSDIASRECELAMLRGLQEFGKAIG